MTDSGPASELQADEGVPDAPAEAARPPLWRRLAIMDWIAIALFVLGWTAVATGLLPAHDARATITRILPLLVFLGSVIVFRPLGSVSPAVRRARLPPDRTGPGANLGPVPALRALRGGHDDLPESGHDRGPAHPGPAGDRPPGQNDGAAARHDKRLAGQHGEPAAAGIQPHPTDRRPPGQ